MMLGVVILKLLKLLKELKYIWVVLKLC